MSLRMNVFPEMSPYLKHCSVSGRVRCIPQTAQMLNWLQILFVIVSDNDDSISRAKQLFLILWVAVRGYMQFAHTLISVYSLILLETWKL